MEEGADGVVPHGDSGESACVGPEPEPAPQQQQQGSPSLVGNLLSVAEWKARLLASSSESMAVETATGCTKPTLSVACACNTCCQLPHSFVARCQNLAELVGGGDAAVAAGDDDAPEPLLIGVATVTDLATLLHLQDAGEAAWSTPAVRAALPAVCRVAGFLGHRELHCRGLEVLAAIISDAQDLDGLIEETDRLPPAVHGMVSALFSAADRDVTVGSLAQIAAAVKGLQPKEDGCTQPEEDAAPQPEPEEPLNTAENSQVTKLPEAVIATVVISEGEAGGLQLEQLDTHSLLALLSRLDTSVCVRLIQTSLTACSMVATSADGWRFAYHAWCAVLQQDCQEADHVCTDESHSGLVRVALAQFLNTLTDSSPSSAATADFLQKSTDIVQLVCDLQRRATLDEIPSAVDTFDGCVARLTWIAAEAEKLGGPDARELLIARTRVPLLKQAAYEACTSKSFGGEGSAQLLQLFTQVIDRTTALAVSVAQSESLSTGDLAEQVAVTAEQRQRLNHAWVRCVSAHHLQQTIFRCQQGKPEQLAAVCARSMESAHTAWAVWKERGWRPPSDPLAPAAHGLPNDVALVSSDGERFVVGLEVARQFEEVMSIIDACARAPLSSRGGHTEEICVAAESSILSKVIEFATYQAHCAGVDSDVVNERNARLIDVDQGTLFHLILASNNMGIKLLLDLTCKAVADMIKGKTPEEIRAHFNIQNDFTPEEEEEVRRENAWCEDI